MCPRRGASKVGTRKLTKRNNPAAIAAIEIGLLTTEFIQPNRNPHAGPQARLRYAYPPPASGSAAPSSAQDNAPHSVNRPAVSHARKTMPTEPPAAAIALVTRKIPVPIIVPTTIAEAAHPLRRRTRLVELGGKPSLRLQALFEGFHFRSVCLCLLRPTISFVRNAALARDASAG